MEVDVEAITLVEHLQALTWFCLDAAPYKNGAFTKYLPSPDDLEQSLSLASISFAPGLFDALKSPTPPTTSFFKNLPTAQVNVIGIYVIVLEKDGCCPKIYEGSGLGYKGVRDRVGQYGKESCSEYISKSFLDAQSEGYTIQHRGLLCWAAMPQASVLPTIRTLFRALEATFGFVLWAMKPTDSNHDYGMEHLCPWPVDSLEYGGLCTHSALLEAIPGDRRLNAEELEAQAIALTARTKATKKLSNKARYDANRDALNAATRQYLADRRANDGEKLRERDRARMRKLNKKNLAANRFHCKPCNMSLANAAGLRVHVLSKRHANALNGTKTKTAYQAAKERASTAASSTAAIPTTAFYCATCSSAWGSKGNLQRHNNSKKHIDAVAAAASTPPAK